MTAINGFADPGFERVRDTFEANFADRGDIGAAFALYRDGLPVVDLWGGVRNADTGAPWEQDTLVRIASATKGITAICANLLVQQGLLDLDTPVAAYWPEFKAEGKESIPVRWALSHQAGVPVIDHLLTKEEVFAWDPVCAAIAAQRPSWEPGTAFGYHGQTYGYLAGELVRRITGRTIGTYLAEEIARPLGLDTYIGLPEALLPRMARNTFAGFGTNAPAPSPSPARPTAAAGGGEPTTSTYVPGVYLLSHLQPDYNSPEWLLTELPAANGTTTARSLAKLYASLFSDVEGGRLLTPETMEEARRCQTGDGLDEVLLRPARYGLGFRLSSEFVPMLGPGSFGHTGAGGSLAFAHPESGVAFAFTPNKLAGNERATALIDAVKESLHR